MFFQPAVGVADREATERVFGKAALLGEVRPGFGCEALVIEIRGGREYTFDEPLFVNLASEIIAHFRHRDPGLARKLR